jgi:Na+/H+ antiporter NhaC
MTSRRGAFLLPLIVCLALQLQGRGEQVSAFQIEAPGLVLAGTPFRLEIAALDENGQPAADFEAMPAVTGLARFTPTAFSAGRLEIPDAVVDRTGPISIAVWHEGVLATAEVRSIPGILSILPPFVAILLALLFRQVVVSLVAGIWLGAVFLFDYEIVGGFFRVLDHFLVNALSERSHVQIVLFSMLFGGMVGVITRNGGARGIANRITRWASTARGGQLTTWAMSFLLFFDDYANVLVRGNLMRPITDRLRISREKLAFLVDTGAATVASIFIISTWIGYEVGLIEQGLRSIGSTESAYSVFIQTIPYRFYPLLALIFAFLVAWTGRDFGPMLAAERRARREGKVLRDGAEPAGDPVETEHSLGEDVPARWINGILPVVAILVVGLYGLYLTGTQSLAEEGAQDYGIGDIVGAADSYIALLWASLSGCVVAIVLSLGQRILSLARAIEAWIQGLKSMLLAMLILVLAWSLGAVTQELHTADYLVQLLRGVLSPFWLPALTFVTAAAVAFSTGTSWATMAIMMPLVIPLAHTLGVDSQLASGDLERILLGVISSVLAGAVFGDHCSPISDTTILSSMASGCDHIDHVRTQLPYAILVAAVGIAVGDLPTAYGMPPWISLTLGTLILAGILYAVGKKVE